MQTDWEAEYQKLNSFFTKIGVSHLVSCPHAHQRNGATECKHRHIVEVGLALLSRASMPLKFWDEAFLAATYLINRIPSKVINHSTPLERLLHQNRITLPYAPLDVCVGLTFDHITHTSFNSVPNSVCFLGIVSSIKSSSV